MADERRAIAVLVMEDALCSAEAIRAVAARYEPRIAVAVQAPGNGRWEIQFSPGQEACEYDGAALAAAFRRDLLDQQLRLDLEKRTGALRELIYRQAFEPAEGRHWWWRR